MLMRTRGFAIQCLLGALVATTACTEDRLPESTSPTDPAHLTIAEHGRYVSSLELLVYLRHGEDEATAISAVRRCEAELVGRVPEIDLWQIRFTNPEDDLSTLQEKRRCLEAEDSIRSVFYNGLTHMELFPDDGYQSGSVTDDCRCSEPWTDLVDDTWGLQTTRMFEAWDVTTGDPAIQIAIVDGDFDTSHRDLAADETAGLPSRVCHHESILHSAGSPLPFADPERLRRHGTHVAGIIGARGDNGLAIAGVNWESCLNLYSVMFDSADIEAMVLAARSGAHVVNRSLGSRQDAEVSAELWLAAQQDLWSPVLDALAAARGGRGTLVVNAAGNGSNADEDSPEEQIEDALWSGGPNTLNGDDSFGDQVLVVASVGRPYPDMSAGGVFTDWEDRWWELSEFSSAGDTADVAAPGASILSLAPDSMYGNGVRSSSGSSMAAPFVTGLASLLFSLDGDLTAAQVHRLIVSGANRGGMAVPGQSFSVISAPESIALLKNGATSIEWVSTMGGDGVAMATRFALADDGSIAICGGCSGGEIDLDPGPGVDAHICTDDEENDVFVVMLDSERRFQWGRTFGGTERDDCLSIAVSGEGDVFLGGAFSNTVDFDRQGAGLVRTAEGQNDAYITRLNSDGGHIWTRTFGGPGSDIVSFVAPTETGRVFVAGDFWGAVDFDDRSGEVIRAATGITDAFVASFDIEGNLEWVNAFGGSGWDELLGGVVHGQDILVVGYFEETADFDGGEGEDIRHSNGGWDAFVLRLSGSGDHIWSRTFGGAGDDVAYAVASRDDGTLFVTGMFEGLVDFDPSPRQEEAESNGDWDVFVLRMNDSGDSFWVRSFGGHGFDAPNALAVSGYDWVYVAGSFVSDIDSEVDFDPGPGVDRRSATGGMDAFVVSLDARGEYEWARTLGGVGDDLAFSVAVDSSGSVLVTGGIEGEVVLEPGWSDNEIGSADRRAAFLMALRER